MHPDTYVKSETGHISVGGVLLRDLALRFGTPLYVIDYETVVDRMRQYGQALQGWGTPYYAGKAFCCRAMVELVKQEGLGLDVVSGGELVTALSAGMDPARILFHGNVKTREEIRLGLTAGVGHFVIDSLDELRRINDMAGESEGAAVVLLRLTPGIEAHTHEFIRTGHFDSKFGFAMAEGIATQALEQALALKNIRVEGFHAHIGSQILDDEPFLANAEALMQFSHDCWERLSYWPSIIDLGGGIGVRYSGQDNPPQPGELMNRLAGLVGEWTPPGQTRPRIIMEPGRSIVAEAGFTLYRVEALKKTPGGRTYVSVDGGMGDNIRPALYDASYTCDVDGKAARTPSYAVTVAGRYCESGDILVRDAYVQDPAVDDLLIVWDTGAYGYSMASTYNRVPRPAVVAVHEGQAQVWIEREDWQDVLRLDRPLEKQRDLTI